MADQQAQILFEAITRLTEQVQQLAAKSGSGGASGKAWDAVEKYRNIKQFSGDYKEWEEFSTKIRAQIAAGCVKVGEFMTSVEDNFSEEEVEADSFTHDLSINEAGVSADDVKEVSQRLHNILLNLTTGEANAAVRRCQGHQGFLAENAP